MQIVIVQQDYTFHNGEMRDHWNVQLLGTGKTVARINQLSATHYELITYGDSKHGNRYRTFEGMDKMTDVVMKWGKRRFSDKKEQ
jgi:hypothetical protein